MLLHSHQPCLFLQPSNIPVLAEREGPLVELFTLFSETLRAIISKSMYFVRKGCEQIILCPSLLSFICEEKRGFNNIYLDTENKSPKSPLNNDIQGRLGGSVG